MVKPKELQSFRQPQRVEERSPGSRNFTNVFDQYVGQRWTPKRIEYAQKPENMQDDATSVPKFKTFKAKVAPGSHLHQTFSHEAANSTKGRWSRSRSPPIDDRHPWPESRNRGRGASDLSPRKLFISDPLGDEKNLIYGSLDRHAIPAYKRSGHGQILGLTQNHTYEVVKGSGTESIAVSTTRSSQKALLSLNQRPVQIPDHHQEALIRSDPVARGTEIEDFVSLIESDHEAVSRAIDADHRTKDVIDLTQSQDAHTYTQPVRGGDVKALAAIRNVSRYSLADGLPSSPAIHEGGSLHTWLQLIKDADVSGHTMSNLGTAAWLIDPKSRAEIRISICEKALQQEWTEKASDVLLICLMKEARLAWDEPKLRRKWKVLLQAGHPQLRLHYADYLKTSARTFQFYEVRQAFLDCIEDCRALASRGGTCLDKLADLNTTGLSCVLQMSQFFLEAGHTEFAISVWQSVLQFAVLNPGIACLSQRPPANDDVRRTQAFEEFWESDEALRIGEAVGEYAPSPENIGFGTPSRNSEMENGQDPSMHKFGSHNQWALSERERSLRYYLPARITEDGVTEDPFRVVLFTDIKNCLFTFDSSIVSPRDLVNGYLNFFQLPAMPIWPSEKAQDPIFNMPVTRQLCGQTMVDVARPMFLWINKVTLDQHTMFNLGDWPAALCSLDACRSSSPATTFLLRSLEALVRAGFGGDELAEYALSIELKISPDTVRGRAKMYLKRWSSSLRLYNALALIESRLGNPEKARSVLVKSLKMTVQMEPDVQIQSVIPWRTLVWELMSTGKQGEAFDQISLFGREDELIVDQRIDDRASMAAQPSASLQTEKVTLSPILMLMKADRSSG